MKTELLEKLETLLEAKNPLEVSREFNQASAQLKGLIEAIEAKESNNGDNAATPDQKSAEADEVKETAKTENSQTSEAKASAPHELKTEPEDVDSPSPTADGIMAEAKKTEDSKEGKVNYSKEADTEVQLIETASDSIEAGKTPEIQESAPEVEAVPAQKGAGSTTESLAAEENDNSAHTDELKKHTAEIVESSSTKEEQVQEQEAHSIDADHTIPTLVEGEEAFDIAAIKLKFKEINAAFKDKVAKAKQELKRIEEETVATAKHLLEELETIVTNEENIGKAFAGFNAVQDKWKSLPKVSNDNYRDLNADYNKLAEQFFYNINIYKELKELDLKKNLEEKLKVLEDQRKLTTEGDIRLLEVEVRLNQDRWNEIGPTFKEEWDKIKDEFWSITRSIYKRIQDFYNQRKAEQEKNLEAKKEVLQKAKYFQNLDLKSPKKWQEKTKEILELQKEWKLIGFVPKENVKPIWKEFRTICDAFFEQKRLHFLAIKAEQDANKKAKEALVAVVEEWKSSTDWKTAADHIIAAQKQWKEIGAAGPKEENWLWRKFRSACDHFFEARKADKEEEIGQQAENLKEKKALLEALSSFEPDTTKVSETIGKLKEFAEKYRSTGHVPFKEKDSINKAYRKLMDEKYAMLKIEKSEKEKLRFEEKISNLKSADSKDRLVQKEMDHIRSKISKIESEINQYENNLGFFANSKGADKLKAEVMKKIEKAKEEVDGLYHQLDMLNEV